MTQRIPLTALPDEFVEYGASAGFMVPRSNGTVTRMMPIELPGSIFTMEFSGCVALSNGQLYIPMWPEDQSLHKNVRLSQSFIVANEGLKNCVQNTTLKLPEDAKEWHTAWGQFLGTEPDTAVADLAPPPAPDVAEPSGGEEELELPAPPDNASGGAEGGWF